MVQTDCGVALRANQPSPPYVKDFVNRPKLTAILSDIGNRQRTSADPSPRIFILRGHRWTLADASPAVFKTVCGL